ncbi:helix-turn-helix transcriptional regulator [Bacteroidales bacterium OttesenSCG-928-A17]|nr:helix-turn-helix transcriptional regulator [Bacteroidales bacterium OttesenSCG-928-A17]
MKLRIKEICKEKGMTITYLAEKLGIKQESLSRTINGNPSLETLEKIARALSVPVSELLEQPQQNIINCPHCGGRIKTGKA